MKKKILSIIFTICLILPCAFIFSACDNNPTEPIMHTVTFVYNNGTENSTIQVEEGKYIEQPNNPSKEGYIFDGWYVGDFKWNFELVAVMNDVTLTAKWTEIPTPTYYSVKFMVDGEQFGETQSIESGSKATCPETEPSKTGYTFDGWYVGDSKWNFELVAVMNDVTLTAKWTEIPTPTYYSVKFMVDGEQFGETQTIESGSNVSCPETKPTKTGYDFDGWYLGDEKWSFTLIPVTENIELVAKWTIKTFTVTFKYENGLEDREILYNYGEKLKVPQQPQKNTDIFLGWFNGETEWDFENNTISGNLELVAKWSPNRLAVLFDKDNGESNMMNIVGYGSKLNKPVNPTKTGYDFDGWYFGEYEWNFGYNTVTEALTLKAHWIAINYSITYELDGGTNNESNLQSYNADNNITFAEATKDSYKFMGWFVDSEFKNEITSTNGYHQHLTVYAKWARINKITYELNGGTNNIDNPTTFFEYEEVVLKAPTKDDEYKVFTGWFLDNHYEEKIETIPAGTVQDIKLWAKWEDIFKIDNKGEQHEKITGLTAVGKTLKKLAIPRNVKGIGNLAFANSNILEEVMFNGNEKVTLGYGAFQNCSKLTSVILPGGTRNIEEASFKDCISLTSITIPNSVWNICSFSFSGCTNLETVIFETNSELEGIMDNVFENCAKLKNITLPSSLKTINSSAFEGCSALEAISIPQNVESIGNYAFADCTSLKSVTFAENCKLAGISRSTFAGCRALETITIPSGVQNIGEYAFNGCGKLASVDFETESQLKCIYEAAFYSCYSLEAITIPKSVTEIKSEVFKGCKGLKTITFESNSGLTCIGSNAFNGCTNLTTITIPKSVQQIKNRVFLGCDELENITFENGCALTYIGSNVFSGCTSLTTITIPSSVEMIGNYLFDEFNHNIERIVFEDTSTWYKTSSQDNWNNKTNGTVIDVSNSEANVEIFISYNIYYLYKINS